MRRRPMITIVGHVARTSVLGLLLTACYSGVEDMPAAQPRSLQGVDVDGSITLTTSGELVLDEDTRRLFDHFLAAEGEVDDEQLHALVRAELERRLHGPAVDEAWEGFLAYLDYRREATALLERADELTPQALAAALTEIRERTIGDAPGVPDQGARLVAARRLQALLSDPALDTEQRAQRMAELQAELGDAPRPDAPSQILSRVHAALAEVPAEDVAARRAVLVDMVGEDAAERWLALERRRADDLAARG